mgnify:CR=1 FL=1
MADSRGFGLYFQAPGEREPRDVTDKRFGNGGVSWLVENRRLQIEAEENATALRVTLSLDALDHVLLREVARSFGMTKTGAATALLSAAIRDAVSQLNVTWSEMMTRMQQQEPDAGTANEGEV